MLPYSHFLVPRTLWKLHVTKATSWCPSVNLKEAKIFLSAICTSFQLVLLIFFISAINITINCLFIDQCIAPLLLYSILNSCLKHFHSECLLDIIFSCLVLCSVLKMS